MSRDEQRELVDRGTILRGTVGSTVHGLHDGGQDDRDEMAIFLEPAEFLLGLRLAETHGGRQPFEHYVERTQPEGARSGPGDLDLVAYSLRKWLRLALAVESYREAWGWTWEGLANDPPLGALESRA